MDVSVFPTKGNLMKARANLNLAIQGFDLLDRKRNILITEMLSLIPYAENVQESIGKTFADAYKALQRANISIGISTVEQVGYAISLEDSIELKFRSVMGVEIPTLHTRELANVETNYSFFRTNYYLDVAYDKFNKVKALCIAMAEIENTIYRLAEHIKKTQKRANALKNIIIPRYKELVNYIQNSLEEKDREEFSRLHVLKERKSNSTP
jgi:V/A-type H+-transporting ATPase subunit D